MSAYQLQLLDLAELRRESARWNELWARSYPTQPNSRAAGIANWVASFAAGEDLTVVVVAADQRLVAGLPLVRGSSRGPFTIYRRPASCWAESGDLLIDRQVDSSRVVGFLLDGLRDNGLHSLYLEDVALDAPQWQAFQTAVRGRPDTLLVSSEKPVAIVDTSGDWDEYQRNWSRNHRQGVRRKYRRLQKAHQVRSERLRGLAPAQVPPLLRKAFEIEDRSWKGQSGTSVLKTPGMMDYMIREAQLAADADLLELWFLYADDKPIAFEYDHKSGGVWYGQKVGYDAAFGQYGPGLVLRYLQLAQLFADPDCRLFDMLGDMTDNKARWATGTYRVGRLHVSLRQGLPRLLLSGYAWVKPALNHVRSLTWSFSK